MRETIVCIGHPGAKAYRFSQTDISISSYEELCCYMSQHMICYLYTLPDEDLLIYIKEELGLDKLYRQLIKYRSPEKDQMKYFATLFREGNYFTEEEIRGILDQYRSLKNEPYDRQCKMLGDLLLNYEKTSMAIQYYEEAIKQLDSRKGESESIEAGNIYHNLGIAHARLFRFEDARIDFVKAYQHNGNEDSLFHYYCLMVLHDGNLSGAASEIKESFHASDLLMETFEERLSSMMEAYQYTDQAARYRKLVYMDVNKRTEDARHYFREFVKEEQRDYRKQLESEENWVVTNLPVRFSIDKRD